MYISQPYASQPTSLFDTLAMINIHIYVHKVGKILMRMGSGTRPKLLNSTRYKSKPKPNFTIVESGPATHRALTYLLSLTLTKESRLAPRHIGEPLLFINDGTSSLQNVRRLLLLFVTRGSPQTGIGQGEIDIGRERSVISVYWSVGA